MIDCTSYNKKAAIRRRRLLAKAKASFHEAVREHCCEASAQLRRRFGICAGCRDLSPRESAELLAGETRETWEDYVLESLVGLGGVPARKRGSTKLLRTFEKARGVRRSFYVPSRNQDFGNLRHTFDAASTQLRRSFDAG